MMLSLRSLLAAVALLLWLSLSAHADKIDDYIEARMREQHISGLSLAVVRDGKIIKARGYGLANVELGVPARPETVYKIGSVSKQFIATGILLLVQDGKVRLDDKISTFLEGTPDTWKEITVRHLLTHTSGIVREAPGFDPLKIQNDADVIKTAYPLPLRFTPGQKWEYCNVGYFALAEIIHKVTGKSWGDFLNERLFTPLKMEATSTTNMTTLVPNRANGYVWRNGKVQNADIYLALRPSGAFLSTVLDLARWDAALYNDGILKQSTREQMWSPVKLNDGTSHPYGFGWTLGTVGSHRLVNHGGAMAGFRSEMARFVDDKMTFIVLTNSENATPNTIAMGVAALYIPGLVPERKVTKVDPKVLDAYVGRYQIPSADMLTVTRQGDTLVIEAGPSEPKPVLRPENETDFFHEENRRLTFRFVKDVQGQVTELILRTVDGQERWRAKRIP
jgi:CubicO group peptidase (beta-lactamase class C family)